MRGFARPAGRRLACFVRPHKNVNAKQFAVAVIPIVLLGVAQNLAQLFLPNDSGNSWLVWALFLISLIVYPSWAGARVARLGGSWRTSCVGGICVLLGTVLLLSIYALFEVSVLETPLVPLIGTVLVLIPIYALFGFLGGKVFGRGKAHVA